MTCIDGTVVYGLGRAKGLTQIDWVRRQLIDRVGIDPHPGTLNLNLRDEANLTRWRAWCGMPGEVIEPEEDAFCRARSYSVRIEGRIPAAVLLPAATDYPADKMELVAALPIRSHLVLAENARLRVELCQPLAAKAILFDIDGTLVDSVGAYHEVARIAAEPFGFDVTREQVRHSMATGNNFWKGVVPQGRRDGEAILKEMSAHAAREWPRVLREFGTLFEGVAQTLDELHRRGIKLGIVSGARPEVMELLSKDGLLDRFDIVVLGGDVARGKPDPEGIHKALDRLNIPPEMALYVGDTPVDIQASRAAGIRAVSVLTGAADSALLSVHEPDRLISSHVRLPAIIAAPTLS
jgi:HAD superfamily hydrolase (TIGR01549 family)